MAMLPGKLMTMPILIVNMGGEMVYILEQRLQAQKIPEPKGQKVLNDVVRTMYYSRFIDELFKPQEMYSMKSTRQIFDRLAHSSIMRLNESSMDKLFDLMAMGFKYQIMSCSVPREIVDVTMNHLTALKRLVGGNQQLLDLLDECVRQMTASYENMTTAGYMSMRQCLCTFFQDRKVKVSLFLHDHTQNHDGSIVVPSSGILPPDVLPPGTVRYFEGGTEVRREQLPLVSVSSWVPHNGQPSKLGFNLYVKDRAVPPEGAPAQASPAPPAPPMPPAPASHATATLPPPVSSSKDNSAAAVGELNMLASLIGCSPVGQEEHFKLENLFGANVFAKDVKAKSAEIIHIDGANQSAYSAGLDSIRQQMDIGAPSALPDAGQDEELWGLLPDQA
mmetsp:Transcript_41609/g.114707  ORF Transcript_41609/g.114707 Transcript_41609/m.114707 type:complete len:390 (+) Transcript_41609:97-1266(+)|eukprot:CAMPEP_0117501178 /NCGR_PEP_ID=MMETSP0784-20121206/23160_1 /TAXON_ID=39447 /ORGANISM="" /LENGTH=389 /DNA_ID=CAMNT_0005296415 /DNA_START=33 /DNA_END=1202 /DNA_ORIENTATION=-